MQSRTQRRHRLPGELQRRSQENRMHVYEPGEEHPSSEPRLQVHG